MKQYALTRWPFFWGMLKKFVETIGIGESTQIRWWFLWPQGITHTVKPLEPSFSNRWTYVRTVYQWGYRSKAETIDHLKLVKNTGRNMAGTYGRTTVRLLMGDTFHQRISPGITPQSARRLFLIPCIPWRGTSATKLNFQCWKNCYKHHGTPLKHRFFFFLGGCWGYSNNQLKRFF